MPTSPPNQRSVRFSDDERGGWSSDRPRRGGGPERPADVSVRGRVLGPTDRLRYSPGSLVVIVSASPAVREAFAARVIEERGAVLSLAKVRSLLAGRVAAEEVEARAAELLDTAVARRLENGESVVIVADGLDWEERDHFVRMAAPLRRPRHLILIEAGRDETSDEDRATLNELRNALDAGEMGNEGFQTALRLGGGSVAELKRIVFRPPPRDD
jgi:predicted kinase